MKTKNRNLGIDLLRILSMYMVVILHVLGQGGILDSTSWSSGQHIVSWTLEMAAYCAVNCFGLISGYVGYQSEFRWSKLISLWLQVLFYSLGITLLFAFLIPGCVVLSSSGRFVLPITTNLYWYISAYVGMLLFTPFLNMSIKNIDSKKVFAFVILFFILGITVPSIIDRHPFYLESRCTTIWLSLLYLLGGFISKFKIDYKIIKHYALIIYIISTGLVLSIKLAVEFITNQLYGSPVYVNMFIDYTSPFIIINAISLLCYFSQLNIKNGMLIKFIKLFPPAALGVYLIHVYPFVWDYLINGLASPLTNLHPIMLVIAVLISSALIYVLCSNIEMIRFRLYILIKIKSFYSYIDYKIKKLIDILYVKIA